MLSPRAFTVGEDLDLRATHFRALALGRATESDALSDEGEFQGCSLVYRRLLNMVDNDDFDRTFPRL
jgi:hypothetical protein